MRRLWAWTLSLVDRREHGLALALFRVGLGLCVLNILLPMLGTGVQDFVYVDIHHGGYRELTPNWLMNLLGGPSPEGVARLCWLLVAGGVLMTLGLGGRLTHLITGQLLLAMFSLNPGAGGGHDRLLTNAVWLLVLGDGTATLSLDCRLRTGRWTSAREVACWPRYLATLQVVVVYTATGLQKLGVDWWPWGDFAAVYKALLMPNWRRFDMSWVGHVYPLTQLLTVGTLVFEIGAPVLLLAAWYRDTRTRPGRLRALLNRLDPRWMWALGGIGLHMGIHLFMNVGPFSWVTMSYYICWWSADEWARRLRLRAQTSP